MKSIKIVLSVLFFSGISFFVIKSILPPPPPPPPPSSGNQFIDKIQLEITALMQRPDSKFCKENYNTVVYLINDFHKYGRFGKSQSENDLWKENLHKKLYTAYSDKFVKQAFYIFNRNEWNINDLNFIRNEYLTLQKSELLERSSIIDKKFNEIKRILYKYDEIVLFISTCKVFSYNETDLESSFPIDIIANKISVTQRYQDNYLENSYVNNCSRLHTDLKNIPHNLFMIHVKYLDKIISEWSNQYINYTGSDGHNKEILIPLREKLKKLDYNIYKINEYYSEFNRLEKNLQEEELNARKHFKKEKLN